MVKSSAEEARAMRIMAQVKTLTPTVHAELVRTGKLQNLSPAELVDKLRALVNDIAKERG
jgi:hypothetical protein